MIWILFLLSSFDANAVDRTPVVSLGAAHTCIKVIDDIRCWGRNFEGQYQFPPEAKSSVYIGGGAETHCFISRDHKIKCWGGDTPSIKDEDFQFFGRPIQLAITKYQVCAISDTSNTQCWSKVNQTGDHQPNKKLKKAVKIDASFGGFCALSEDSEMDCWGSDVSTPPQLSNVTDIATADNFACALSEGQIHCWARYTTSIPKLPLDMGPFKMIAGHSDYLCAVNESDKIYCAGKVFGQEMDSNPKTDGIVTSLVASDTHICATNHKDEVVCWGDDSYYQTTVPFKMKAIDRVVALGQSSCFHNSDGWKCWGYTGHTVNVHKNLENAKGKVTEIAGDYTNLCFIEDGEHKCFGRNRKGYPDSPKRKLKNASSPSRGGFYSCALEKGKPKCWGTSRFISMKAPRSIKNARSLKSSFYYSCVITIDDQVKCWGFRTLGRNRNRPTQVPKNLPLTKDISLGLLFACASTVDGVRCWGENAGDIPDHLAKSPVNEIASTRTTTCAIQEGKVTCFGSEENTQKKPPTNLKSPRDLTAGEMHFCVMSDEGPRCWGDNSYGQLRIPKPIL